MLYKFEVSAYRKGFKGPASTIQARTNGTALPVINNVISDFDKVQGTAVKLKWDPPKYPIKAKWVYGVYYAISMAELYEGMSGKFECNKL